MVERCSSELSSLHSVEMPPRVQRSEKDFVKDLSLPLEVTGHSADKQAVPEDPLLVIQRGGVARMLQHLDAKFPQSVVTLPDGSVPCPPRRKMRSSTRKFAAHPAGTEVIQANFSPTEGLVPFSCDMLFAPRLWQQAACSPTSQPFHSLHITNELSPSYLDYLNTKMPSSDLQGSESPGMVGPALLPAKLETDQATGGRMSRSKDTDEEAWSASTTPFSTFSSHTALKTTHFGGTNRTPSTAGPVGPNAGSTVTTPRTATVYSHSTPRGTATVYSHSTPRGHCHSVLSLNVNTLTPRNVAPTALGLHTDGSLSSTAASTNREGYTPRIAPMIPSNAAGARVGLVGWMGTTGTTFTKLASSSSLGRVQTVHSVVCSPLKVTLTVIHKSATSATRDCETPDMQHSTATTQKVNAAIPTTPHVLWRHKSRAGTPSISDGSTICVGASSDRSSPASETYDMEDAFKGVSTAVRSSTPVGRTGGAISCSVSALKNLLRAGGGDGAGGGGRGVQSMCKNVEEVSVVYARDFSASLSSNLNSLLQTQHAISSSTAASSPSSSSTVTPRVSSVVATPRAARPATPLVIKTTPLSSARARAHPNRVAKKPLMSGKEPNAQFDLEPQKYTDKPPLQHLHHHLLQPGALDRLPSAPARDLYNDAMYHEVCNQHLLPDGKSKDVSHKFVCVVVCVCMCACAPVGRRVRERESVCIIQSQHL